MDGKTQRVRVDGKTQRDRVDEETQRKSNGWGNTEGSNEWGITNVIEWKEKQKVEHRDTKLSSKGEFNF